MNDLGKQSKIKYMTREEMINYAMEHPYTKISHILFGEEEYIYTKGYNIFYEENDYVFEDWELYSNAHDGLRARRDSYWSSGWFIKGKVEKPKEESRGILDGLFTYTQKLR